MDQAIGTGQRFHKVAAAMCGIAGVWQRQGPVGAERWEGMLDALAHRGPDGCGQWSDIESGLWLGHRRLSIIDRSQGGHQPMQVEEGRSVLAFNGEIYNYPELRRRLEGVGHRFRSDSDTEVLLRGYEYWGEMVLYHLVGMFAFAIWDPQRQWLFLARDRAGEKPLYYSEGPRGIAFASELTPLGTLPFVDRTINPEAIALYLQFQYVPAPLSIFNGVRKLPPGHALRVTRFGSQVWRYWDPLDVVNGPTLQIGEDEAVDRLDELLSESVRGQMRSDVPVGAFLSGGIDSTAVVQKMTLAARGPVRTFTIGFGLPDFNEADHAAAVARHLGTEHFVEYLTEGDALNIIPSLPAMFGEPFADSSAIPTHMVSRIARKHVGVSLSGDGGDECWGGYTRYVWLEKLVTAGRGLGPMRAPMSRFGGNLPGRIGRAASAIARDPGETYRRLVSLFSAEETRALSGSQPTFGEFDRAWTSTAGKSTRRRAMATDLLTFMPEAILVKVDRSAMAVSLETRSPLLDHRLLEFSLRLPDRMVKNKYLLKRLVHRAVPRQLVERPKQGFGIPVERWFRTELRQLLLDTITPATMSTVGVDAWPVVERLLQSHLSGRRDHSAKLWALLVLGLWSAAEAERNRNCRLRRVEIAPRSGG